MTWRKLSLALWLNEMETPSIPMYFHYLFIGQMINKKISTTMQALRADLSSPEKTVLGIHSLSSFTLTVPDIEEAKRFFCDFGLETTDVANGFELYAQDEGATSGFVTKASSKKLLKISFNVFPGDLPRFAAHLEALGIECTHGAGKWPGEALCFRDLDGLLIELQEGEVRSAYQAPASASPPVHGVRSAPFRGEAAQVKPLRLAHVMIFVTDVYESIDFYSRTLGLRLSDEVNGHVAFMHGPHGSDHHILALLKSQGSGLHHSSWDVGTVAQVGQGAMQMAEKGFKDGWGLGRFVLGSNYFHYVKDPWGSYAEYVSDIDYIPSCPEWVGQSHRPEKAFYLWGPEPPSDFGVNHELNSN